MQSKFQKMLNQQAAFVCCNITCCFTSGLSNISCYIKRPVSQLGWITVRLKWTVNQTEIISNTLFKCEDLLLLYDFKLETLVSIWGIWFISFIKCTELQRNPIMLCCHVAERQFEQQTWLNVRHYRCNQQSCCPPSSGTSDYLSVVDSSSWMTSLLSIIRTLKTSEGYKKKITKGNSQ